MADHGGAAQRTASTAAILRAPRRWRQAEAFPATHDGDPVTTALALSNLLSPPPTPRP